MRFTGIWILLAATNAAAQESIKKIESYWPPRDPATEKWETIDPELAGVDPKKIAATALAA